MKKLVFLMLGLIVLTFQANAQGEKASGKAYSLEQCISIAIENNPDMQVAKKRLEFAEAGVKSAFGSYLPSADFSAGYSRQLNTDGAKTANVMGQIISIPGTDPNSYNMSVGVGYNIFDGFARSNNSQRADLNKLSSNLNVKAYQEYININVRRLYVEVIKRQQVLKLQQENFELGKAELEAIKAKFEAGLIHEGVLASQEADLANREFAIVQAENDLNINKSNLLIFMGLQPNQEAEFMESSLPTTFNESDLSSFQAKYSTLENSITKAMETRSDVKANKVAIDISKSSLESARSGYYPRLSASLGWSWSNTKLEKFGELGRSYLGLNLSVPIFDQFQTDYQIESAKFEIMQNETEFFKLEQTVRNAIRASFLNLAAARKQLEISNRALAASQKNFDITKERFNIGSSNITDYLVANNALINSQLNRVTAIYTYYLAERELEYQVSDLK